MKTELGERLRTLAPLQEGACAECGQCLQHVGDEHVAWCEWIEGLITTGLGALTGIAGLMCAWPHCETAPVVITQGFSLCPEHRDRAMELILHNLEGMDDNARAAMMKAVLPSAATRAVDMGIKLFPPSVETPEGFDPDDLLREGGSHG